MIGLALDMLEDERMRQILKWRYGLSDGVPRTLLETARLLHEYEVSQAATKAEAARDSNSNSTLPKKPLSQERIRGLAEQGLQQMEAFIREHNLLRDLLN